MLRNDHEDLYTEEEKKRYIYIRCDKHSTYCVKVACRCFDFASRSDVIDNDIEVRTLFNANNQFTNIRSTAQFDDETKYCEMQSALSIDSSSHPIASSFFRFLFKLNFYCRWNIGLHFEDLLNLNSYFMQNTTIFQINQFAWFVSITGDTQRNIL